MTPRSTMNRRTLVTAAAAAAFPWMTNRSRAGEPTLRISATPSIFKEMFQRLCDDFRKRHPDITLDLSITARGQEEQLQSTLRQSLIGDLPDVSFQGFPYLRVLQRRRVVVPLNDLIRNDPEWSDTTYGNSLIETGSVGESVVGLGTAVSVPIIYYNADRVDKLLGSQPMPGTWTALLALIARLATQQEPRFLPGYCRHAPGNWTYTVLVESQGGRMMSPDESRIAFDGPAGRRALEIFREFGRTGQARANLGREQARQAFAAGFIGILIDSSSSLATFEKQIGKRFRLGTASIPVADNGRIPISGVASVLLTRNPARQAAAWKFMKFVAGTQGQRIVGQWTGYFPANDLVVRRADGLGDFYSSRPQVKPIIRSLEFASRMNVFPGDNSAKIDDIIYDELAAVIALSKTPEQALATLKRQVTALLPRDGG